MQLLNLLVSDAKASRAGSPRIIVARHRRERGDEAGAVAGGDAGAGGGGNDLFAAHDAAGALDRLDQAGIDAAAADVGDRGADRGFAWVGIALQQDRCGHDDAGDAKAALDDIAREQGELERMRAVARQPLDRGDVAALDRGDGDSARRDRAAVNIDDARAAFAGAAAIFGAGQVGCVAQRPEQRRRGVEAVFDGLFVDGEAGQGSVPPARVAFID